MASFGQAAGPIRWPGEPDKAMEAPEAQIRTALYGVLALALLAGLIHQATSGCRIIFWNKRHVLILTDQREHMMGAVTRRLRCADDRSAVGPIDYLPINLDRTSTVMMPRPRLSAQKVKFHGDSSAQDVALSWR